MQGWECPKCGRCYSPFVMECSRCNNGPPKQTKEVASAVRPDEG